MTDVQPLIVLLQRTEEERDAALATLRRAQGAAEAAQTQAEQLLAYRRDYEQRWGARFAEQGRMELVQCYQGFVGRLTQAVEHQQRVIEQSNRQVERAQDALQQVELRVASVRKLVERRVAERARLGAQREERQLDEMASRAAWNRLAAATRY